MKHKSIIGLFSIVFGLSLLDSVFHFHSNSNVTPEAVFSSIFIVMTVVCIWFFERKELIIDSEK